MKNEIVYVAKIRFFKHLKKLSPKNFAETAQIHTRKLYPDDSAITENFETRSFKIKEMVQKDEKLLESIKLLRSSTDQEHVMVQMTKIGNNFMIKELLELGASVETRDQFGRTLLMVAYEK